MVLGLQHLATMITPRNRRQTTAILPTATAAAANNDDPFKSSSEDEDEEEAEIPLKPTVRTRVNPFVHAGPSSLAEQMKAVFSSSEEEDSDDDDDDAEEEVLGQPPSKRAATNDKAADAPVKKRPSAKENKAPNSDTNDHKSIETVVPTKRTNKKATPRKGNLSKTGSKTTKTAKDSTLANKGSIEDTDCRKTNGTTGKVCTKTTTAKAKSPTNALLPFAEESATIRTAAPQSTATPSPQQVAPTVATATTAPSTKGATSKTTNGPKKPVAVSAGKKRKAESMALNTPAAKKVTTKQPCTTTPANADKNSTTMVGCATTSPASSSDKDSTIASENSNEGENNPQPKPRQRKKKQPPLEQAQDDSLNLAQSYVTLAESMYKTKVDAYKKADKELKKKRQELQEFERHVAELQQESTQALEAKKLAAKQHRSMIKQWDKVHAATKAAEEAKRHQMETIMAESKPGKIVTSKKKKRHDGSDKDDQKEDDDLSEDDDSDWEGAKKTRPPPSNRKEKASPALEEPTAKNSRVRRSTQSSWICPRCTLENKLSNWSCEICDHAKPGTCPALD